MNADELFYPPESHYQLLTAFTVEGEPGRKSNGRRLVRGKNGRPLFIKSAKAMAYEESFLAQVPEEAKGNWGSPKEPLALWAHIYYASNRPDLSTELVQDILQKAGVVANDRYFKGSFAFGSVDKDNPRAEIRIYKII